MSCNDFISSKVEEFKIPKLEQLERVVSGLALVVAILFVALVCLCVMYAFSCHHMAVAWDEIERMQIQLNTVSVKTDMLENYLQNYPMF